MLDGSLEKTTVKYMYALERSGRLPWPERPASGLSGTDLNSVRPFRPGRFGRIASARPLRSGRFGQTASVSPSVISAAKTAVSRGSGGRAIGKGAAGARERAGKGSGGFGGRKRGAHAACKPVEAGEASAAERGGSLWGAEQAPSPPPFTDLLPLL